MSGDPRQYTPDPRLKRITLALAGIAVLLAGILPAVFSLLPANVQPWNLSIIGAIGLFAASRLGFWHAVGFTGAAIAFKDINMYLIHGWRPSYMSWPLFIGYGALGWAFLRRTQSPLRIEGIALTASVFFFVVSNFLCWLQPELGYEQSFTGLIECYAAAVPFFRGTILGDLAFTGLLFGAHAALSRVYFHTPQPVAIEMEEVR